jgi:hypothetical protein
MKIVVLGFIAGLALAFASAGPTWAQEANSLDQSYYDTVASPNCVGTNNCTFTFKQVPISIKPNAAGILTVTRVNCRIVTPYAPSGEPLPSSFIYYAALGKTSNAAKLFFYPARWAGRSFILRLS